MELDSLKDIWQQQELPVPDQEQEELRALLQKKSRGPVATMQRNLTRELRIVILTYIPAILYLLFDGDRFWGIALQLFLLGLFYCIYYYRKRRLLNTMLCVSCEVRSNLARQVTILKKYTHFYLIASTAILPLTTLFTWLIFIFHQPRLSAIWYNPLLWIAVSIPLTAGLYYLNRCYINKLYGRHIKKLQQLLWEMEEE